MRTSSLLAGLLAFSPAPLHADPGAQDLALEPGDHVCLLGNALAERMRLDGWLETRLHCRFPGHELTVRNLGFGGDELGVHQRTRNFGKMPEDDVELDLPDELYVPWDRYLARCEADVVFAFFGFNESFGGREGLARFREDLERFVRHVRAQRYDGEGAPRLVLFSPIPHEDLGDPALPDGAARNADLALYAGAMRETAERLGERFVDLMTPMAERYRREAAPLTINGVHLSEYGNEVLAEVIDAALFGEPLPVEPNRLESVRAAVLEKSRIWFQRYRATDGYNVYGGRSRLAYEDARAPGELRSNFEVLQREMAVLDVMTANRDRRIRALARGEDLAVDDGNAPPLIPVATNKPGEGPDGRHAFLHGDAALDAMTVASGMRVETFADERRFPELVNPVQMAWDTRDRLWVAVWPTYPHWTPGEPMDDKLLVLEDVDGDGRADTCEAFADDLHNPTGFEHWNGGVVVACAPDVLFLEDTDGDGRADAREVLLHGLSSADTHHASNSFVLGPDGALYFQEGTFHKSQVESVHGPVRNRDACVWRFHPRTWRVERYVPYDFANPHGHVFDRWGQDFVTDGTGNQNYWALPFTGYVEPPAKQPGYFPFFEQRSRPAAATEILSSRHFPDASQGNYLVANVIGFRGIFQYEVVDDGSGFGAVETEPIVHSADQSFRPSDVEIGPDGALYFLDWHNPLIGHMQHHLRDPSRDREHGRVYRVTVEGRELLAPPAIAGRPVAELLALLEEPEDRVRYRARIELSARDTDSVLAAIPAWLAGLDEDDPDHEHHLLEALWLFQQHARMDRALLERLLEARDPRARAAATRALRHGRHLVERPLELLLARANDPHPRVRLEAVVAASFFDSDDAVAVALEALEHPTDRFLDHALAVTLRTLEPVWKAALQEGRSLTASRAGVAYLLERVDPEELARLPRHPDVLGALLTRHGVDPATRREAAAALAAQEGVTPAEVVHDAIRALDRTDAPHAAHVLHELGGMLQESMLSSPLPRAALVELAEDGARPVTRQLGYAALVDHDRSAGAAWESALGSHARLGAFLGGVQRVSDPGIRASLYECIRPLAFAAPPALEGGEAAPLTGLRVEVHEPAPADARLETLASRSPSAVLRAPAFGLDLEPLRRSDSFGLVFRGTLFVPRDGTYTLSTRSDDGSRLYVDGTCVVDNDGDHSAQEQSAEVALAAGPHPVVVTYYERGGSEELSVSWQGPGLARQQIPASALGAPGDDSLRAAAIRAVAHVPGHETQKFRDAVRLIGEGALLGPTVELLRAVPRERWPEGEVRPLVDTLAAYASGLSAERRTAPDVLAALELGRELAGALPPGEAETARRSLEGLGGSVLLVRTVPHKMVYDVTELWAEAGEPVAIVFQNNDVMPHNLVVTRPGALAKVGTAAESLPDAGADRSASWIPPLPEVLWHTRLLVPGESERLAFVAPAEPGDYPFVCTFPGHWRAMNAVLHVVEELDPAVHVTRRAASEEAAAREFVRDWRLADLEPALTAGWERGRSLERGRRMAVEAGCIKCHAFPGDPPTGGPDLSKIGAKYAGRDLLQHLLEPSKEVLEGYESHYIVLADGGDVTGRIVADDGEVLHVLPDLQYPESVVTVRADEIEARSEMRLSAMPAGLLVTLEEEEILDLLAYLQSLRD